MDEKSDRSFFILIISLILAASLSCSGKRESPAAVSVSDSGNPLVYTSILPLKFITGQIAGDLLTVESLLGETDNPHTWTISPAKLRDIQNAKLIIRIGGGFENYLTDPVKRNLSSVKTLELSSVLDLVPFAEHGGEHGEGEADGHHHEGSDPHFWLSPGMINEAADAIYNALAELKPQKKDVLAANLQKFRRRCNDTAADCRMILDKRKSDAFFVFHPSFGYYADSFGLQQIAVETDGKAPAPRQLREVMQEAEKHRVSLIISQPQFSKSGAEAVAKAIGGEVLEINHLQENLFTTLRQLSEAVAGEIPDGK
jgi:zinc transport system substrate-binding protein